jgi:hypothetical protein
MAKTSFALGADIKKFYADGWPEGAVHEDNELQLTDDNGEYIVADSDKLDLSKLGLIIYPDDKIEDFSKVFRRWKKAQTTATILVEVPKERVDFVLEMLAAEGYSGKVS